MDKYIGAKLIQAEQKEIRSQRKSQDTRLYTQMGTNHGLRKMFLRKHI